MSHTKAGQNSMEAINTYAFAFVTLTFDLSTSFCA